MGLQAAWAILPVAFAGYLVGGLGHGVKNVLLRALIAARVPEAVHGRAFAAYNAARSTAELGALGAGGVLVDRARPARRAGGRRPRPDPGRRGGADRAAARAVTAARDRCGSSRSGVSAGRKPAAFTRARARCGTAGFRAARVVVGGRTAGL